MLTVKNISELRAFTGFIITGTGSSTINNTPPVYVKGYNQPGDGGGGTFIFIIKNIDLVTGQTFPMQEDNGVFIDPNSQPISDTNYRGIWIRQFTGDIDVRYYGAMGNLENYTIQIQSAIDYAIASKEAFRTIGNNNTNTIYFPNGDYKVNVLKVDSGIKLRGASKYTTVIIANENDNELALIVPKEKGRAVRDLDVSNLTFRGTGYIDYYVNQTVPTKFKSCFYFDYLNEEGGLWESTFKNLIIDWFTGHSFYFAAGTNDYISTNQFITMENVFIESVGQFNAIDPNFNNTYHALKLYGEHGQLMFNNCTFNGGNYLFSDFPGYPYEPNGIPVSLSKVIIDEGKNGARHPSVISFNTCSIQNGEQGIRIDNATSVKIDTCWFELLKGAIWTTGDINSKTTNVNISNSNFLDCSGKIRDVRYSYGNIITAEKYSLLNIHNNFIVESHPDQNTPNKFIYAGSGNSNLGIASTGNYTRDYDLNHTFGIKKTINTNILSNNTIDIIGAKMIELLSSRNNIVIKQITSTLTAGEIIFIKVSGSNVRFDESRNIYLGNMNAAPGIPPHLILNDGGVALFIKVDDPLNVSSTTYYDTYNLVSYKNKE